MITETPELPVVKGSIDDGRELIVEINGVPTIYKRERTAKRGDYWWAGFRFLPTMPINPVLESVMHENETDRREQSNGHPID